ncbi:MAG TPA: hypothetical protein DEB24_08145, partial [Coriobacteriia bacterium]|nr:hypothetical protein [Coriobacteriia bacterium]
QSASLYKTPTDPLTVMMIVKGGETMLSWEISDEAGVIAATGTAGEIDISALGLAAGHYDVTWNMLSVEGVEFKAHWAFNLS